MSKRAKNISIKILSERKYKLHEATFDYQMQNGEWVEKHREYFDRGNACTILLFNTNKQTVILNRQFRFPTLVNGNEKKEGFMYETPAGSIEESDESPESCMMREIEEETGYRIPELKRVCEAYSTPAAVTEKIYYFVAEYTDAMKVSEGGGIREEKEDIEVVEMSFDKAVNMMNSGKIQDAKTILLLQYAQIQKLYDV